MKRYNRANKRFVLLGLVLPILVFFISYTAVFAYFTASSNQEAQTLSAIVKIGFQENQSAQKISHEVKTNGATSNSATIMPGDVLVAKSTIINEGNVDVYSVFNFTITIEKTDGTTVIDANDYYTFTTEGAITKLISDNGVYINPACKLAPNQTVDVEISKLYQGVKYGNDYKKAKLTYSINALAIQASGVGSAINATNLLINNQNGTAKNLQIFGNTQVTGTPSAYEPATIQSVGDKTINLLDYSIIKTSTSTPNALDNAVITDEYVDIVNQSQYDYTLTSVSVKANQSYTICGEAIVYDRPADATDRTTILIGFTEITNASASPSLRSNSTYNIYLTFTAPADATYYFRMHANYGSPVPAKVKFNRVMLVEGTYAQNAIPEYEPYGKYKVTAETSSTVNNISSMEIFNSYIKEDLTLRSSSDSTCYVIPCDQNSTYTFTHENDNNTIFRVGYIVEDKSEIPPVNSAAFLNVLGATRGTTEKSLTVKAGAGAKYLVVQIQTSQAAETAKTLKMSCVANIYLDKPLRKIGDYSDYIDFATGTVVRFTNEIILTGEETFTAGSGYAVHTSVTHKALNSYNGGVQLCSHFTFNQNNTLLSGQFRISDVLYFKHDDFTVELEDFVNYAKGEFANGTPIVVDYVLMVPTVEVVNLPNILDYSVNSVTIGTTISPSMIINLK